MVAAARVRQLKGREVVRALEGLGFTCVRTNGPHHFMRHPDGRTTVVPVHRGQDVGRGLLRKILSDIDMTHDEFMEALQ